MTEMSTLMLTRMLSVFAARSRVEPYPGWRVGSGESNETMVIRLRKRLWERLKTPYVIRWIKGLRIYLYPGNELSRVIFLTGYFEPNEFSVLDRILKLGMTFVDIGANMGLYTLFASKKIGPKGIVLAIEPSTREFQRLQKHVGINCLSNVLCLQIAISNCRTEADLLVATEEKSGHNTLGAFGYDSVISQGCERVHLRPLDDMVREEGLQRVDVIKMDIEGAEFLALQGSASTLAQFHPLLLLELSDRTLSQQECNSQQVWQFLTQNGYRIYAFDSNTGLPILAQFKDYFDSENIIALHEFSEILWPY